MNGNCTKIVVGNSLVGRSIVKITLKKSLGVFVLSGLEVFNSVLVTLLRRYA